MVSYGKFRRKSREDRDSLNDNVRKNLSNPWQFCRKPAEKYRFSLIYIKDYKG